MNLIEIFKDINLEYEVYSGNCYTDIENISLNSNEITKNDIFVAIKGFKNDGHNYIATCFKNGIRNFIVTDTRLIAADIVDKSTIVKVKDGRTALAMISNYLNGNAFDKLFMIGVTGTKGKTTTSTLIQHILSSTFKANLFSTVKNIVNGITYDSVRTTMEADKIQRYLKESVSSDTNYNVVEVSSHALTLKRVFGINWNVAIFTNFSQDHLDLYETMDNYFQAKLDLFRDLNNSAKKNKIAIVNIDDPKGKEVCKVLENTVRVVTLGKSGDANYRITQFEANQDGIEFTLVDRNTAYKLQSKLRGEFNIHNIALAFICLKELGVSYEVIKNRLAEINGIEGRFEIVIDKPYKVIIDYAHTPDSLEKILKEGKKLSKGRLISIFGCTGDRDRDKRATMGAISGRVADYTIITNDDTYTEDPMEIAKTVVSGLLKENKKDSLDYEVILDRKAAIAKAISIAKDGDVVVIAGMGHEKYQIIGNNSIPYSDKATVLDAFKLYTIHSKSGQY